MDERKNASLQNIVQPFSQIGFQSFEREKLSKTFAGLEILPKAVLVVLSGSVSKTAQRMQVF